MSRRGGTGGYGGGGAGGSSGHYGSSTSYGGGGSGGTGGSSSRNKGEHRPLDISAGLLRHLDRRLVDSTACGPVGTRRSSEYVVHPHPGWRVLQGAPRDNAGSWGGGGGAGAAGVGAESGVASAHVSSSGKQKRIEVKAMGWSVEGRRLVTANNEGSLTTWSGLDFSHQSTLTGHSDDQGNGVAINALAWVRDGSSFITGDANGVIKYFEWTVTPMTQDKICPSPGMPITSLSAGPTSSNYRFASAGEDACVRVWDWSLYREECCLRGHGMRIHCVAWHPSMALIASAGKDHTVRLWDPRIPNHAKQTKAGDAEASAVDQTGGSSSGSTSTSSGACLATLHWHKSDVTGCAWNPVNGWWLLSSSKDQTCRLFDIRSMKAPVEYVGHDEDVQSVAWHPVHERLFSSGGSKGSLAFWTVGGHSPQQQQPASQQQQSGGGGEAGVGPLEMIRLDPKDQEINPHTQQVYARPIFALAWHPLGHVLATGSKDQTIKFWARKGAGAAMLVASAATASPGAKPAMLPPPPGVATRAASERGTAAALVGGGAEAEEVRVRFTTHTTTTTTLPVSDVDGSTAEKETNKEAGAGNEVSGGHPLSTKNEVPVGAVGKRPRIGIE